MKQSFATIDSVRLAMATAISLPPQQVQHAIGQLLITTSAEHPTAAPGARSIYDATSRTTILLADRIPAGRERLTVAHEVLRWHGLAAQPGGWSDAMASEIEAWAGEPDGSIELAIHEAAMAHFDARPEHLVAHAACEAVKQGGYPLKTQASGGASAWLQQLAQSLQHACDVTLGLDLADMDGDTVASLARSMANLPDAPVMGRLWWSADNIEEARHWETCYTSKGAQVKLIPEDDRPIVDVLITLERSKAKEIMGYDVEEHEWLIEDDAAPMTAPETTPPASRDEASPAPGL